MRCERCEGEISETAKACMHCGAETAAGRAEALAKRQAKASPPYVLIAMGIVVLIFILRVIGSHQWGPPGGADFEELVRKNLKDPASATFSDTIVFEPNKGVYVMCGFVNSKNSYGAYAGNSRFIAGGSSAMIEDSGTDGDFDSAWYATCTNAGGRGAEASPSS